MRVTTILAAIALALASVATAVPASAQQYPAGRNMNDGGIAAQPSTPQYNGAGQVVAAPGNEVSGSNCAARFHSFDPATGTYMGRDGQRHPCP